MFGETEKRSVLVVDDSELSHVVARRALDGVGLVVDAVSSLQDATLRAREGNFVAILLDVILPATTEDQLLEFVSTHAPKQPILTWSGIRDTALLQRLAQAGRQRTH